MPIHDEIERKYLLCALPAIPASAVGVEIEQGYLDAGDLKLVGESDAADPEFPDHPDAPLRGRIRRERRSDGSVICTNTVKRGQGLVRQELEQSITEQQFEANWHRTAGARLRKTRHRVTEGDFTWEIDDFHDLGIQVAEVELPAADVDAPIPVWLAPCIVREVTGEATYRNLMLACRAAQAATGDPANVTQPDGARR